MDLKRCLCCGYKTLEMDSVYDICPVCFWEDDPIQNENPDYDGGANEVCLTDAQKNFKKCGAIDSAFLKYTRKPTIDEM